MTRERISYVDLGAGIMILWMILGHALGVAGGVEIGLYNLGEVTDASLIPEGVHAKIGADGNITGAGIAYYIPLFLFFFMPWFFYKSGQFFTKRAIKDEWTKDWRKLMRQFLFWSALGYILHITFSGISGALTLRNATYSIIRGFFLNGHIELNVPLWFLFTLFGVRQIANIILPEEGDKYYWLKCISVIIVGFLIAFGAYCFKFRLLPLWVANGSAGLAFFTLGYCMQKYETKYWLLVPCIVGYIACCIWGFPDVGMRSNSCENYIKYLVNIPAAFAGIVTFNVLCRLIAKYLHYISLPFEYVGKYAMIIYVSHGLLYYSVPRLNDILDLNMSYSCALGVVLGSYIIFLPLFCYLSNKIHT